jgi:hypothetical protein
MLEQLDIDKLSDIDYVKTLSLNRKYYAFQNINQNAFSLNLNNNEEFTKLFLLFYSFAKIN